MRFALAGNQNCGKTTLFNALTGSNQHVGNFPGVTVEQKVGDIKGQKNCTVVDLPGIYSLRPYTQEEIVTRDYIINEKPDGIINIVDATNIERNLYLTLQLLELRVLALNMMDEVRANGGTIDVKMMSDALGIPVIPVSAAKGEGISDLIDKAVETARNKTKPVVTDFCSDDSAVHRCIHAVVHLIMDHANRAGIPPRFCASKLIEGDKNIEDQLELNQNELELLEHCIVEMEDESKLDRNAALADMRYDFIEKVVAISVVKCHESREHKRSVKIDRILTGKYTALPVFFGIMFLVFFLTFNVIGSTLSDWLSLGIDKLTDLADKGLTAYGINPVVHSLIIDGVFAGVGSVLSFLPIIVTLFFFLSILEDTGYMARVAFVMDKLLRKIGLSGRSFVPMLIVPFVMELPNYRLPSAKSVGLLLWDKAKDFIQRAFTVIFFATIIIWFLETFDAKLNVVKDSSDSLLALIGQAISPIFKPLGFADWRVTTSLISGFTAKEAVVSTMAVLMNTSTANLGTALSGSFSTLSALSFLVFTLLYTPCVAAVATIKRELDSRIQTVGVVIMQCMVAWLCGCAVYQIGALL